MKVGSISGMGRTYRALRSAHVRLCPHGVPAWLGIGAQRSGTTWFTDLLTQHPQVGLGTNGKKEQHLLHKVADGVLPAADYLDLFPADDVRRGEWTPQYLRHASAPAAAARLVPDAPVLVLLRDPVERFRSAMRLAATRAAAGNPSPWPYPVPITMQTFTGFYADQLAAWAAAVGRERMVVMVYEQVRRAPQAAVDDVWRRLDLDPVPLAGVEEASGSSSRADWDWPEGLKESLQVMYRPQLARLESDWGLDVSDWTATLRTDPPGSADDCAGGPGGGGQLERRLGQPGAALGHEPLARPARRPGRDVVAGRAGAHRERLPPVLERREPDRHVDPVGEHVGAARPRPNSCCEVPLPDARRAATRRSTGSQAARPPTRTRDSGPRPPAWSQTQAATTPPGRVTRAISDSPRTGSAMKWTTSWASAASTESSA